MYNEVLIEPSLEEALQSYCKTDEFSFDSSNNSNNKFNNNLKQKDTFNTKKYDSYSYSNSSNEDYLNNNKKYTSYSNEETNNSNNNKKYNYFDTSNIPNDLFEKKHYPSIETSSSNKYNSVSNSNISNSDKYASISSDPNYKEYMNVEDYKPGIVNSLGSFMSNALTTSKDLMYSAKDKSEEMHLSERVKYAGFKTFDLLKNAGVIAYKTGHSIAVI